MRQNAIIGALTLFGAGLVMIVTLLLTSLRESFTFLIGLYWLVVVMIIALAVGLLMLGLALHLALRGYIKQPKVLAALRYILIALFPLLYTFKPMLKHGFLKVERDFVRTNNLLVLALNRRFEAKDLLILTPHCLQSASCEIKVTNNIEACTGCGACQVSRLKEISERNSVPVIIATGGTLARKAIRDRKPACIIAVACERDLISGILDARQILTYGVINDRPNGPCFETCFQSNDLESALAQFLMRP